jgi:hypothetical protein
MIDPEVNLIFQEPEEKIIQKVIEQIEKDFGMASFEFENAPYPKIEMLIPELEMAIEQLQQQNHSKWMKIVYRVDLTEKQYKFVQKMGGSTPLNMAKAVILREFQKVKNRLLYS